VGTATDDVVDSVGSTLGVLVSLAVAVGVGVSDSLGVGVAVSWFCTVAAGS